MTVWFAGRFPPGSFFNDERRRMTNSTFVVTWLRSSASWGAEAWRAVYQVIISSRMKIDRYWSISNCKSRQHQETEKVDLVKRGDYLRFRKTTCDSHDSTREQSLKTYLPDKRLNIRRITERDGILVNDIRCLGRQRGKHLRIPNIPLCAGEEEFLWIAIVDGEKPRLEGDCRVLEGELFPEKPEVRECRERPLEELQSQPELYLCGKVRRGGMYPERCPDGLLG